MVSRLDRPLIRLRRKLILAVWLGRLARQGAAVLVLAGSAILLGRVAFELELEQGLWLLAPLAVVPFSAWRGVRRRVPSRAGAAAWLDLRSGAQGLLLADFERHDGRWTGKLERQLDRLPELPALRLTAFTRLLLPAAAFCALALFVPLSRAEPAAPTAYYDRAIEGLADQLEVLEEVAELDPETSQELEERLRQLAENVDPSQPEAMLEAIDSLRRELGLEGQEAAELAQDLLERFGAIGAEALGESTLAQELMFGQLNEMLESGLMTHLLENMDELGPELLDLAQRSAGEGGPLRLPEGFQLDPEQMRALSRAMQSELRHLIGELDLAGLVDMGELAGLANPDALSKLLERFHEHDDACAASGECRGQGAGALGALGGLGLSALSGLNLGGPSREGGSTGVQWGDESAGDPSRFASRLLSPSRFADLAESETIGLGVDAPEVAPEGQGAGLLDVQGAEGEVSWRRRLSPRHRDAVREFFQPE